MAPAARAKLCTDEEASNDEETDRDPRRRHRRHDDRQPAAPPLRRGRGRDPRRRPRRPARLPARPALRALRARTDDEIVRPRRRQLRNGIVFHENEVESVSLERDEVLLDDGTVFPYDVLVVASGVRLQPEETEGMTGPAGTSASSPSTAPRAPTALRGCAGALRRRPAGREPRRHADQVPGRAARVRLPRRLVPARARHPRPHASSSTRRRSTVPSPSRSPPSTWPSCSARRRSSW